MFVIRNKEQNDKERKKRRIKDTLVKHEDTNKTRLETPYQRYLN